MTTNKRHSRRKHLSRKKDKKDKKHKKHSFSRRRHRRHRHKDLVSSWEKHYTYETDITSSETNNNKVGNNEVQAVHGLRDFLQGKK